MLHILISQGEGAARNPLGDSRSRRTACSARAQGHSRSRPTRTPNCDTDNTGQRLKRTAARKQRQVIYFYTKYISHNQLPIWTVLFHILYPTPGLYTLLTVWENTKLLLSKKKYDACFWEHIFTFRRAIHFPWEQLLQ